MEKRRGNIGSLRKSCDEFYRGGLGRAGKAGGIGPPAPPPPPLPSLPFPPSPYLPYLADTRKCPRRFCCQQDSFSSLQNGCSFPLLTNVTRSEAMPRLTRYALTASARRDPSARLYSELPRESQCPST